MNNLLDVRKIEEGKMVLKQTPLSLSEVVSGVHTMLKSSVKPGVDFKVVCQTKGRDWVLGDQHRMAQVFVNATTNAIKYTVSGSISLVIGWENEMVKFECIDTGPGIPKAAQEVGLTKLCLLYTRYFSHSRGLPFRIYLSGSSREEEHQGRDLGWLSRSISSILLGERLALRAIRRSS